MTTLLACERLADHGELRCFERDGPPVHYAFETLQDADGRSWTLRVPRSRRDELLRLLHAAQRSLAAGLVLAAEADGTAVLATAVMTEAEELAAVVLEEAEVHRFALWLRERGRDGWSWTLDAVFVPLPLAPLLCRHIERAVSGA